VVFTGEHYSVDCVEALKKRKILLRITFSVFVLGFSIAHAMTPSPQHAAVSQTQSHTLIVGSEQAFPPFSTGMTDATAGGFTVELWKAVAAEAGLNYSIRVLPFHQILQEFKDGKIDVLINLAKSDERKAFAEFSVPHVVVNGGIFVRKNQNKVRSERNNNWGQSKIKSHSPAV
jgi:ABC-type amino acid transport substrate-binding protein